METEELELYVKPLMEIIPMTKNAVVVTSECELNCGDDFCVCPDAECPDDCPDDCYDCDIACPDVNTCGPADEECPDGCNPDCDAIEE